MQGSATSDSQFRVLWLGQHFVDPLRTGLRPERTVPYVVTGPDGLSLLDTAPPGGGPAGAWLSRGVDALLAGRTHLAGHLLATAGIVAAFGVKAERASLEQIATPLSATDEEPESA